MADVEDADALAHRGVLLDDAAAGVLDRHLPAAEVGQLRARGRRVGRAAGSVRRLQPIGHADGYRTRRACHSIARRDLLLRHQRQVALHDVKADALVIGVAPPAPTGRRPGRRQRRARPAAGRCGDQRSAARCARTSAPPASPTRCSGSRRSGAVAAPVTRRWPAWARLAAGARRLRQPRRCAAPPAPRPERSPAPHRSPSRCRRPTPRTLGAIAEGALLGAYAFTRHRGRHREGQQAAGRGRSRSSAPTRARRPSGRPPPGPKPSATAVHLTRDLSTPRRATCRPPAFADAVVASVKGTLGSRSRCSTRRRWPRAGYGGIIGVGQGSTRPPRLVRLAYRPAKRDRAPRARRQGHHVRLGRPLAQAARGHGGDEVRHGRRGRRRGRGHARSPGSACRSR